MAIKGRVLTGARARFKIDGVKVGYATEVTVGEDIDFQDIDVLDDIEVVEQVAVAYRVRLSARTFRLVGETFKSKGLFPKTGVDSTEHLANILVSGDLTATIEDSKTEKILATVSQVKIASTNWSVSAKGVVGQNVEFKAIRMKDESEVT